jgi:AcrR family transcriptional regulator
MGGPQPSPEPSAPARPTRRYESTVRRERAAQTRARIVDAGCALLRASSIRDWRGLTIRAVAAEAGVNERTVYRHFGNERSLRDGVMRRLEEESGIDLAGLALEDVAEVTARIFASVSRHPLEPRPPLDPTLSEVSQRQREALVRAVAARNEGWSESDQTVAAAMFDVLWAVAAHERLVVDWGLERGQAVDGLTWVVGLIEEAVRAGRAPSGRGRPVSPS